MPELATIMWVQLGAPHHHGSRTDHEWIDSTGKYKFEPFHRLEIKQIRGESGFLLLRFTMDNRPHGQIADSECESVEEAVDQAQWEFGVRPEEWQKVIPQDRLHS